MQPGEPGTKKLLEKYGQQLLCVRYRKDNQNEKCIITVKLIVDDGIYQDALTYRNSNTFFTHPQCNGTYRIQGNRTQR